MGASVVWCIVSACDRIAEERRLALGRASLLPKKLVIESPRFSAPGLGQIRFRFYPQGDARAEEGYSTLFAWLSQPAPLSFIFRLRLGSKLDPICDGADSGNINTTQSNTSASAGVNTSPRMWPRSSVHYRIPVVWAHM